MLSTRSHKVGPCDNYDSQKFRLGKSFRKLGLKTNHAQIISHLPSNEASQRFLLAKCCKLAKSEGLIAKISKGNILEIWDWQKLKAVLSVYKAKIWRDEVQKTERQTSADLAVPPSTVNRGRNRRLGVV